jgi:hypothetical protein
LAPFQNYHLAKKGGWYGGKRTFLTVKHHKPDTQLVKIAKLHVARRTVMGLVTAATASGIGDGAGSIVVATVSRICIVGRPLQHRSIIPSVHLLFRRYFPSTRTNNRKRNGKIKDVLKTVLTLCECLVKSSTVASLCRSVANGDDSNRINPGQSSYRK